jgi:hypothetical protein
MKLISKDKTLSLLIDSNWLIHFAQTHFARDMPSLVSFLCVFLSSIVFIQGKGTHPPVNFKCNSFDSPTRIDVVIETGSQFLAGTDDTIRILLRDSHGVICLDDNLDNFGNDHERNSIDHHAICCPQDFSQSNDSLSLLLLSHLRRGKSKGDDWFIERIKVHMNNFTLFDYRFHMWTYAARMFGASRVTSSRSNNGKLSYSLICF